MNSRYTHSSHFDARLGANEEQTELYKKYSEGVPQVGNNAWRKEHGASFGLRPELDRCDVKDGHEK